MSPRCALLCLCLSLCELSCADDLAVVAPPPIESTPSDRVDLIGVSGRRLLDGDVYGVPLDYMNVAIAPGSERREAFVLVNDTPDDVLIISLAVVGSDEWTLLAPTRAQRLPLHVEGLRLAAGGRVDFDVGFRALVEGERTATLELVVERQGVVDARVIELRARCARDPP